MANQQKIVLSSTWRTHLVYWPGLLVFKVLAWPAAKVAPRPTRWLALAWLRVVARTFAPRSA